jgi:hypothetical protein
MGTFGRIKIGIGFVEKLMLTDLYGNSSKDRVDK